MPASGSTPSNSEPNTRIQVQEAAFDPGQLGNELCARASGCGAVVTFVGLVRDLTDDPVKSLYLEHYPGMTEKALAAIAAQARQRWDLGPLTIVHRVGHLKPGEAIVFVGATSAHRGAAFEACEFLMDYLKVRAPLWKKESTPAGERWVSSRCSDNQAAARW